MCQHIAQAATIPPQPVQVAGVSNRPLWGDPVTGALTVVTEMAPGATIPRHKHSWANEAVYVLEGDFIEDGSPHGSGTYFVGAHDTFHGPHTTEGRCMVLTHFSATLDFVSE